MSARFSLNGDMIPRTVKRMFDQRSEQRRQPGTHGGVLSLRGRNHLIQLVNLSSSGAMVRFTGEAYIGETVSLQLLDRERIDGQVRWLRDGRMGVLFDQPQG